MVKGFQKTPFDSVFAQLQCLITGYNGGNTCHPKERSSNKKLCSARVVTENTYSMLKGRWRLIYENYDCQLKNIKYIIMADVFLHNPSISMNDTYQPRWRHSVE